MNKKNLTLLSILSLVLVVLACDPNYFGRFLTRNSSIPPAKVDTDKIDCPPGADCSKDYFSNVATWEQVPQISSTSAEIVFVLDRSGSMSDNVNRLTLSLTGWMDTLDNSGLPNYCVGLMSAVADTNAGKLQGTGGEKCFCRYDSNGTQLNTIAQIKDKFTSAVSTAVGATGTDSNGESGIFSIHTALNDAAVLADNQAAGCFKDSMALAVILMSDENDVMFSQDGTSCSGNATTSGGGTVALNTVQFDNSESLYGQSGYQSTTTSSNNYTGVLQCGEVRESLRKYHEATPTGPGGTYKLIVSPQSVADELLDYNSNLPSYLNSIVYPVGANAAFNTSSAEGPGHGYFEISEIFAQTPIDLSLTNSDSTQGQFNTKMNALATDLVNQLTFQRIFNLVDENGNPASVCAGQEASLKVKVNNVALATSKYTLSSNRRKVTILPSVVFHTGDDVKITFTSCI